MFLECLLYYLKFGQKSLVVVDFVDFVVVDHIIKSMLSAYNKTMSPVPTLTISFICSSLLIVVATDSIATTHNNGERGQPCPKLHQNP